MESAADSDKTADEIKRRFSDLKARHDDEQAVGKPAANQACAGPGRRPGTGRRNEREEDDDDDGDERRGGAPGWVEARTRKDGSGNGVGRGGKRGQVARTSASTVGNNAGGWWPARCVVCMHVVYSFCHAVRFHLLRLR